MEHLSHEKQLRELGLLSMEKTQGINVYKYIEIVFGVERKVDKENRARLFSVLPTDRKRRNEHKMKYKTFQLFSL